MAIIRVMPNKTQQIGTFKQSDIQARATAPTVDAMSVATGSTEMDELFLKYSGADNYTEQFNDTLQQYANEFAQTNAQLKAAATVERANMLKQSGENISYMGTGAAAIMQENIDKTVEQSYSTAYAQAEQAYNAKIAEIQAGFAQQLQAIFGKVDMETGRFQKAIDFGSKAIMANNALMNVLAQKHSDTTGNDFSMGRFDYLEQNGLIEQTLDGYTITDAGYQYIDSVINAQNFDFGKNSDFDKLVNQIIRDQYGTEFDALDESKQNEIRNEWERWLYDFSDSWRYSSLGMINDDGTVDNFYISTEYTDDYNEE